MRAFVYFLPILHYLTVLPDHRVGSLTISNTGVEITSTTTEKYQLIEEDIKGLYHYLYVRQTSEAVNLIVYYRSVDEKQCYFLRLILNYPSVEACKKANTAFDPEKSYFETWYSPAAFKTYSAYPSIAGADSATLSAVGFDLVKKTLEHSEKMRADYATRSTNMASIYGGNAGQNILSNALIAHHLNPNTTLSEFTQRVNQVSVNVPNMPVHHSAARRPTLSADSTAHRHSP